MASAETVLITGSLGQDARLLVELLDNQNVNLILTSRDTLKSKFIFGAVKAPNLHEYLDISDTNRFVSIVQKYRPDKIYNFAGLSSVSKSFSRPIEYQEVNGNAVERVLVKLHRENLLAKVKFYQASSSEIFDPLETEARNETSTKRPQSPYGLSKLYAFEVCQEFRQKKGYFICSGILFNHESEHRGEEFLFGKVMNSIARIKFRQQNSLTVGNLDARRDWGYARDYVKALDLMTSCDTPEDYVVATGERHSVKEVIDIAHQTSEISTPLSDILVTSDDFLRKKDHSNLHGSSEKIYHALGWEPSYSFENMVQQIQLMVLKNYQRSGLGS